MPVASFFVCEVVDVKRLLKKMRDRIKYEHELQYVALCNAIGKNFSKNYKYFNMFEKEDAKKKEVTRQEKDKMRSYLDNWKEV